MYSRTAIFMSMHISIDSRLSLARCRWPLVLTSDTIRSVRANALFVLLGAGMAVISTPYPHAMELLRDDVGILVPFEDANAIATAVIELLDNPERMDKVIFCINKFSTIAKFRYSELLDEASCVTTFRTYDLERCCVATSRNDKVGRYV